MLNCMYFFCNISKPRVSLTHTVEITSLSRVTVIFSCSQNTEQSLLKENKSETKMRVRNQFQKPISEKKKKKKTIKERPIAKTSGPCHHAYDKLFSRITWVIMTGKKKIKKGENIVLLVQPKGTKLLFGLTCLVCISTATLLSR